jgi:cell division protein FtsQ
MTWKRKIWRIVLLACWCLAGTGLVALLIAAVSNKKQENCSGYDISIHGASEQLFLEKSDILEMIPVGTIQNVPIKSLDLRKMEEKLETHAWIREAQLFIDNNGILKIRVEEREPIARIFTVGGSSFYIDSACEKLPLTDKIAVRLPVFTGFPSEGTRLSKADKLLLRQVKDMSLFISKEPFWSAQIAQVDITSQRNFEMVPTVGNHIIEFGDGSDIEGKFRRLFVFYQQVMSKSGLNGYERVNVQFARQVIGKRSETRVSRYDSLLAVKKIQQLIIAAQRMQPDTIRSSRPLETSTVSEHQLRNYDLVPDSAGARREPDTTNSRRNN